MNLLYNLWFNKYLPCMLYLEGGNMKRVDPELKFFKMQIVSLFHNEIIFRANKYQQFCWLGNDEQVIKTKIRVRGLMVSEFVCPWNGKMVDPDTWKPC